MACPKNVPMFRPFRPILMLAPNKTLTDLGTAVLRRELVVLLQAGKLFADLSGSVCVSLQVAKFHRFGMVESIHPASILRRRQPCRLDFLGHVSSPQCVRILPLPPVNLDVFSVLLVVNGDQ